MNITARFLALALAGATTLRAQVRDTADKTLFTGRDAIHAGAIVAGSAIVSAFDERIAHWSQKQRIQGSDSRHDFVENLTFVNEQPLTIAAVALYGVGRLAHNETMADIGLHTTEALVLTVGIAEAIRSPLGRVRPRESFDDPFNFKWGAGFHDFAARSYPSLHAAVAWTTATALVGETRIRNPEAAKWLAPILYTAATIPGFTRIYLNQHWASDVVAGTFTGMILGSKVVRYSHTHQRSKLDKFLLGAIVVPDPQGGMRVGMSFSR